VNHQQQQLQGETQARLVSELFLPSSSGSSYFSIFRRFILHDSLGYPVLSHSKKVFMPLIFAFILVN
jgi:hypothetical protein